MRVGCPCKGVGIALPLALALAVGGHARGADDGAAWSTRPPRLALTLSFRPPPGLGGLAPFHESWLVLEPLMPLPPSYVPSAATWQLGPSAASAVRLGAGAAQLVEGVLGRVGVAAPEGLNLFYAGPFGVRAERALELGHVPTRFCVTGQYDLGDQRVGPGWSVRFMVAPRF
jgi:hypothetical protein